MKRLESGGCVISRSAEHNGRLRKYYEITQLGAARIDEFLSDWQDIMKAYYYIEREKNHV